MYEGPMAKDNGGIKCGQWARESNWGAMGTTVIEQKQKIFKYAL